MKNENWDTIIESSNSVFKIDLKEIWKYRDLLYMFIKRDFVTFYKQTILGPIWFFAQPLITTLTYVFIFGKLAGLSTEGKPQILFYIIGVISWNYFAESLVKTSTVFKDNQHIFGKVYFPRIVKPLSLIISSLLKFIIQFLLFLIFLIFYVLFKDFNFDFSWYLFLAPILVLTLALNGLALGLIITSLTTKYRDLVFLVQFGVQLFMYASPVIYPISSLPINLQNIMELNPLSGILESFRFVFLNTGNGIFNWNLLMYSIITTLILLFMGIIIFNKTEKNFIDTI